MSLASVLKATLLMKIKTREFLEELSRWGVKARYEWGRIVLREGNDEARKYYASPEFEGALIWELAQTDENIMDDIEERRAIRWVEGGDDSIYGAIMCNIPDLTA